MAVLVRTSFQMREFEERFVQLGLSYRVIGGPRFYERMEIRDILAYLRVIMQPSDDLALERVINVPKRGIGDATVQAVYEHARARQTSFYDSIQDLCQTDRLRPKVRKTLMHLIEDFERWRSLVETTHHAELAGLVMDQSGYMAMWKSDKSPEAPGRLENLKELISAMQEFESLAEFLEHIALVLDNQSRDDGDFLTLMTLHGAKGLEFDCVFLPGWEDGLFPSQRSMDENGLKGLEEERRLAYVGITRAKQKAYISSAANRRMYGNWINALPSRFVEELPFDHVESYAQTGLYKSGRSSHWDSLGVCEQNSYDSSPAESEAFQRGERVIHGQFGQGIITNIDGRKLDINFDEDGHKRVMDHFIEKVGSSF